MNSPSSLVGIFTQSGISPLVCTIFSEPISVLLEHEQMKNIFINIIE